MDVIYVDAVFLRNAVLDYLLLLSAARLVRHPLRRGRFALAAALGGVFAAGAAVPPLGWLAGPVPLLAASLGMARLSFGPAPGLWRGWGAFLALSAAFAGAVYALGQLTGQRGGPFFTAPPRLLLLSFGGCYALAALLTRRLLRAGDAEVLSVEIVLGDRTAVFPALRDTGNRLSDPLSGRDVLVADPRALASLFPPGALDGLPEDAAGRFRRLSELPELRGRLRLVPFAALGTKRGLLVGFRPDRVTAEGRETDALAALSPTPLEGEYRAIW